MAEAVALTPEYVEEVFIQRDGGGKRLEQVLKDASAADIRVTFCDKEALLKISKTVKNQGIAARVKDFDYSDIHVLLDALQQTQTKPGFLVVLDHLEDPHNLGAIARTTEFFGGAGMIIPKVRSASITPGAIKSSAGALANLPVARVSNITSTLKQLKREGVWVVGADPSSATAIDSADLRGLNIALVLGAEGAGVSRLVKENCDFLFSISRFGEIDSLNASVAAGIFIYEFATQWRKSSIEE